MKNYIDANRLFKQTKLRFFLFSVGGAFLILLTSLSAYNYQKNIIVDQAKALSIYSIIGNQLKLIDDLVEISDVVLFRQNQEVAQEAFEEFKKVLSQLNRKNLKLIAWINGSSSISTVAFEDARQKKRFEELFVKFMKQSDEALSNENFKGVKIRENVNYLTSKGRNDLKSFLYIISDRIENHQQESMRMLSKTSIYLILFMAVVMIAVWTFVFQPLYLASVKLHSNLSDAMLKTESANRLKNQFLANISHEIRTPMTAILGYSNELVSSKMSPKDQKNAVRIISHNASHLMELIDEILDVSKIESGKFQVEATPSNLSKILSEVHSLLNVKAREKGLDFVFENTGQVPEIVSLDPKRLKQILFNLLGNAIKFTDFGMVKLQVSMEVHQKKTFLRFDVIDTGCGIDRKDINRLFRPFEQLNSNASRKHGGTGLGLVLSKGIAREMGGDLRIVESEVGRGTRISATIYIDEYISSTMTSNLSTNIQPNPEEEAVPVDLLAGENILVVDDAKENARLFSMSLARAGAAVDTALNGDEAIQKVKENFNKYSLVLLDLQMPKKDGFSVLEELKETHFKKPIVALTAHAMKEEKEKTKAAGFDGHLTKPISPAKLALSAHQYITNSRTTDKASV